MADIDAITSSEDFNFLIVRHDKAGILDLFKFLVFNNQESGAKFLQSRYGHGMFEEELSRGAGKVIPDHRWVIFVSIIVRKIIKVLGKPMEWIGYLVEFILNLLSLNGNLLGLISRILHGNVVMPKRDSETFISAIGHLDGRIDLFKYKTSSKEMSEEKTWQVKREDRALMDLCIMASKLAYENAKVVRNIVNLHWKMHFVDFYNCWNEFQKENSTQAFIMCDKSEDANLILVSFRGTEPFDADDWITDFDYSWYEFPELGKVHMGFLEALGLGNRDDTSTFQYHLQAKNVSNINISNSSSSSDSEQPESRNVTAYYAVRNKVKELLTEHKKAKLVVTGHSLGGALAIMFPIVAVLHKEEEMTQRLLGVYTYGQPRVGNRQLGKFMEAHLEHPEPKYLRVVYCSDLVPRLPYDNKTFLYKHFGICLYYNSLYIEKHVKEEPNRNYFGLVYLMPDHLNSWWELIRSLMMGYVYGAEYKEGWESFLLRVIGLEMPGIAAHSPVDYVNSVRLGRSKALQMRSL